MSENLDLVRSIYADWERGDYSRADWAHPEIEFTMVDGPSPGRWTGPSGMARGYRDFLAAWADHRAQTEEYQQLDDRRILVFTYATGRGKTSGMELGPGWTRVVSLFELSDAKVTRLVIYMEPDRALADLGLEA
jgi:ketosteroid isomerase-like protein